MTEPLPRVGVPDLDAPDTPGLSDRVRDAGGEPVPLAVFGTRPEGGVALAREWFADRAEVAIPAARLDALLAVTGRPEEVSALLLASLRTELPLVFVSRPSDPFSAAVAALGLAPLFGEAVEAAVEVARAGGPEFGKLTESFSFANALRASLSLRGGPETVLHLMALSREAVLPGFSRMLRVLAPEIPAVTDPGSRWFEEHGVPGLLSYLGDDLHETRSITGGIKEGLPPAPEAPDEDAGPSPVFVKGRASSTEGLCLPRGTVEDGKVSGECRTFTSEDAAVRAVARGDVEPGHLVVLGGCGPRGAPGVRRLWRLEEAMLEAGLGGEVPVFTDGLAPDAVRGSWVSLVSPEAAARGVIGRLRDGDALSIYLEEGRIRAGVPVTEVRSRDHYVVRGRKKTGYAARYASSALAALEGAGFG